MVNPEVQQAWQSFSEQEAAEQAKARQDQIEEDARLRDIQERVGRARETALALTKLTGWHPSELAFHEIYDTRFSNNVPLGVLDEAGATFGFGQVRIIHAKERKEVVTERGWRAPLVDYVYVPTDKLEELDVVFYAGDEDGSNLRPFGWSQWYITDRDNDEGIAEVEHDLAIIAEALGQQNPTE